MLILLWMATHGHHAGRRRGERCLQAFLEAILKNGDDDELEENDRLMCRTEVDDAGGLCSCLARALSKRGARGRPLTVVLKELLLVLVAHLSCLAAAAWLQRLLRALHDIAEGECENRLGSDLCKVEGLHIVGNSGSRKRRPDQDYVALVTQTALQAKRARTTGDLVTAFGDFSRSSGAAFVTRQLADYLAGLHMSVPRSLHLSVVADGARLDNPARDNLLFAAIWDSGEGVWLPQQALQRLLHGPCIVVISTFRCWRSPLSFRVDLHFFFACMRIEHTRTSCLRMSSSESGDWANMFKNRGFSTFGTVSTFFADVICLRMSVTQHPSKVESTSAGPFHRKWRPTFLKVEIGMGPPTAESGDRWYVVPWRRPPPKALPEYSAEAPVMANVGQQRSKQQVAPEMFERSAASIRDFLQSQVQLDELKRCGKQRKRFMDDVRLSNRHYALAFDGALRNSGHEGLVFFAPRQKVGALREGESRYEIPDTVDGSAEGEEPLSAVRMCVRGPAGKNSRATATAKLEKQATMPRPHCPAAWRTATRTSKVHGNRRMATCISQLSS